MAGRQDSDSCCFSGTPYIRFLSIDSHIWSMLLSGPHLAAVALASSLGLHLHPVGRRTFTSKLLSMPSTQRSRLRGGRYRVYRHKRRNCPLEERMGPEVRWGGWLRDIHRWASITAFLAKVPFWQGFSGRNQLNSRPPHPRGGFLLTVLSKARQRNLPTLWS